MKEKKTNQKEYYYNININLVEREKDLLFNALDFYACGNILINDKNNAKKTREVIDLFSLIEQCCHKEVW